MEGICRRLQRLAAREVKGCAGGGAETGKTEIRESRAARSAHAKQTQARLQGRARARRIAGQTRSAGKGAGRNRRPARGSRAVSRPVGRGEAAAGAACRDRGGADAAPCALGGAGGEETGSGLTLQRESEFGFWQSARRWTYLL